MKQFLICNSSAVEVEHLRAVLETKFSVWSSLSWDHEPIDFGPIDAVILDSNFTPAQGLNFLMEIANSAHVPILLVIPPDAPQCAIEGRRSGAFTYLIKTERMHEVIEIAVQEMIGSCCTVLDFKRTIAVLKKRVAELAAKFGGSDTAAAPASALDTAPTKPNLVTPGLNGRTLLQEIVARFESGSFNLPTFPRMSLELAVLPQKGAGLKDIAVLVSKDSAVSAKLLSIANSPRYRGERPCMTAEDAMNVLGIRTAKENIDIMVNRTLYTARNPTYQPALKALWQHGVACAHASRLVAECADLTTSREVFFMGLMHDIGKLLLLQILAEIGRTLPAEETERVLKQQHGVFRLKLMERWKLPTKYALAARYHDALAEAPKISNELLSVNLGNL